MGLHTDDLQEIPDRIDLLLSRNSINDATRIMGFGHEGQILSSQDFVLQLLTEIRRFFELSQTCKAEAIEASSMEGSKGTQRTLLKRNVEMPKAEELGIWDESELRKLLETLALPPVVRMEICESEDIAQCFSKEGLPIIDFGHYTDESDLRRRLFSLGAGMSFVQPEASLSHMPPIYGCPQPPIVRVPIIQRSRNTTDEERQKLIDSLQFADHITCYGYSNIRMMRKIYSDYVAPRRSLEHLQQLKVIFYTYEQYRDINEGDPQVVAQVHWIMGFLYASWIAKYLRSSARQTEVPRVSVSINTIRYGFNVFKVTYAASTDREDNIRFTVPMPGKAFELSPVFVIKRGAPLYHGFMEICERYIEQGRMENSDNISVRECSSEVPPVLKDLFEEEEVKNLELCQNDQPAKAKLSLMLNISPNDLYNLDERQLAEWIRKEHGDPYVKLCKEFIDEIGQRRYADAYRLIRCCEIHKTHFATNQHETFLKQFGV